MSYLNGVTPIPFGTAPTAIATPIGGGIVVQNLSPLTVYLGGPGVTADTSATGGVQLGTANTSNSILSIPGKHAVAFPTDVVDSVYGRVASGTANVSWIASTT
jgi:hypothetical protein